MGPNALQSIMRSQPEIFFHCGMMRTGTTFLQKSVFPFFEGIHYVHKKQYHDRKAIVGSVPASKFLISYELAMDGQWEKELTNVARAWPHATPIVVLRKHSEFLLSEYKRQLKNGTVCLFSEIWDPENEKAFYQTADLLFDERLGFLEKQFSAQPVLLLYSRLREDARIFIQNLARIMKVSYHPDRIDLTPRHTSYDESALIALRKVQRHINLNRVYPGRPTFRFRIKRFLRDIIRYGILYSAPMMPRGDKRLVPEETLARIDEFYATDWQACLHRIDQQRRA